MRFVEMHKDTEWFSLGINNLLDYIRNGVHTKLELIIIYKYACVYNCTWIELMDLSKAAGHGLFTEVVPNFAHRLSLLLNMPLFVSVSVSVLVLKLVFTNLHISPVLLLAFDEICISLRFWSPISFRYHYLFFCSIAFISLALKLHVYICMKIALYKYEYVYQP